MKHGCAEGWNAYFNKYIVRKIHDIFHVKILIFLPSGLYVKGRGVGFLTLTTSYRLCLVIFNIASGYLKMVFLRELIYVQWPILFSKLQ